MQWCTCMFLNILAPFVSKKRSNQKQFLYWKSQASVLTKGSVKLKISIGSLKKMIFFDGWRIYHFPVCTYKSYLWLSILSTDRIVSLRKAWKKQCKKTEIVSFYYNANCHWEDEITERSTTYTANTDFGIVV